jgi:hypothetical protein
MEEPIPNHILLQTHDAILRDSRREHMVRLQDLMEHDSIQKPTHSDTDGKPRAQ